MISDVRHGGVVEEATLREIVMAEYGLPIGQMDRIKSVMKLRTEDGDHYFFKVIRFGNQERHADLARVLAHVNRRGVRTAMPLLTAHRQYHVRLPGGQIGYLQREVIGEHANYSSRQDRLTAVAAVAYLHQIGTEGYVERLSRFPGLPLIQKLQAKRQTFLELLPEASKRLGSLDPLPAYHQQGLWAWSSLLREVHPAPLIRFCHRDMAPHNFMFSGHRYPTFIDFDLAGYDHPFVDLLQIVNHSLALTPRVVNLFSDTIQLYRDLGGVQAHHLRWLWSLFAYPEILVRSVIEWARIGFDDEGKSNVITAIEREEWRASRLAEECPFELYYQRMDSMR